MKKKIIFLILLVLFFGMKEAFAPPPERLPDLAVFDKDISFGDPEISESQPVNISAIIHNIGDRRAGSFLVQFFDGQNGTLIREVRSRPIGEGENVTLLVEMNATLGPHNIFVLADAAYEIVESNKSNNVANNTLHVSSHKPFGGNITTMAMLQSSEITFIKWTQETNLSGNVLIADDDSSISFSSLQALGVAKDNISSFNDFNDVDVLLNMSIFLDSIKNIYTINGSTPNATKSFFIGNKWIANVPVRQSLPSSQFVTGVLWDTSDDSGNKEFDINDKEDLIFVSEIHKDYHLSEKNDFLVTIPARLRNYKGGSNIVFLYVELH